MFDPTTLSTWKKLQKNYKQLSAETMRSMFESDPTRFQKFSIRYGDLLFDYSKNIINEETISLLCQFASEVSIDEQIESLFTGEKVNFTENRAALHTALRNNSSKPLFYNKVDIIPDIKKCKQKIKVLCENIHSGKWLGCTGKTINTIVNIGIGGSDLGPRMVCEALKPYAVSKMKVFFVSNVDGTAIQQVFEQINPETSLFIISSKSFTTEETMLNANTAKKLFLASVGKYESDIAKHFIAVSSNITLCENFGIAHNNIFAIWDWVGGRYSLWSAIGLSIALYIGYENFEKMLDGAYAIDIHFRNTEFNRNIPVIMALLGIWYANFFNAKSYAIIPYTERLNKFVDYLQQLDMESNGKSTNSNGKNVNYQTGPIIWGSIGTNAQHSFFQNLHQGTQLIPADFIAPINEHEELFEHHRQLISNCIAQTEALMLGKSPQEALMELQALKLTKQKIELLLPHKIFPGNKPSNTILYRKLTPEVLGNLIAIYEHKVFVQGVFWNINSFDQWGVELGKQLAKNILPELEFDELIDSHDCSTNALINYYKQHKENK